MHAPLTVSAWRDHEPATLDMAGMQLGTFEAGDDPVATASTMFGQGARRVRLPGTVKLDAEDPVAPTALALVRELTSYGIAVDWDVDLGDAPERWILLSHLYPPHSAFLANSAETGLKSWQKTFHLAKLSYRHGPNFIQVRDYRKGKLRRHLIGLQEDYKKTFVPMLAGVAGTSLPRSFVDSFGRAGLILDISGQLVWLPCRSRHGMFLSPETPL